MIEFDAFAFVRHSDTLQRLQREVEEKEEKGEPLTPQERQNCAGVFAVIRNFLPAFELDVGRCFDRLDTKLSAPDSVKPKLSVLILELRHRINDKLEQCLFMFIPAKEAECYNHYALFGQEVATKFPKANKEITAAGNCYATGNHTACVFHCMRAVEIGARTMVSALRVRQHLGGRPPELCEWQELINALEKGVDALRAGTRTSAAKKAKFEFYNHALAQFRNYRDAWRNNVSHTRKTYQAGQTKDIIDNTRQFMQHLAERLKESAR